MRRSKSSGSTWPWQHVGDDAEKVALLARELADLAPRKPPVVCLCGSTRFYDAFQEANYDLTMKGAIVLSVGFYPHSRAVHGHGEGVGHDSAEKVALDELHKRKIDLADSVLVLNVGGYIGESTRSEIGYAVKRGLPVRFLEPVPAELVSAQIRDALEDGQGVGEWLWEYLGEEDAAKITALAGDLVRVLPEAEPDRAGPAGHALALASEWDSRSQAMRAEFAGGSAALAALAGGHREANLLRDCAAELRAALDAEAPGA